MRGSLWDRTRRKVLYYRRGLPWYGMLLRVVIDGLAKCGIRIEPYHLVVEGLGTDRLPQLDEGVSDFEIGFLGSGDMKALAAIPGRSFSEADLLRRLEEGSLCLGVKRGGEVVAFTWCNVRECQFERHHVFPLQDAEAYLFDAYTVESFRGKDLAPRMRYRCYQELARLGRVRCYSITVLFNTPAARFKEKLGAQVVELRLFIELLGRVRLEMRLRDYRTGRSVALHGRSQRG